MAEEYTEMTNVGEIEGYQVFYLQGSPDAGVKKEPMDVDDVVVKAEPVDNGYEAGNKDVEGVVEGQADGNATTSGKIGQTAVKNIVENLLQKNDQVLAQHDLKALKPSSRTPSSKQPQPFFKKNILVPSGPTEECTTADIPDALNELVEADVVPKPESGIDPGAVCAVSSRVVLMSREGKSLNADVTLYWCNFCSYKSDKKDQLLQHVLTHRFRCHKCAFQSFSRATVMQHEVDNHEGMKVASLKFCALLPDIPDSATTIGQSTGKRKRSPDNGATEQAVKRDRLIRVESKNSVTSTKDIAPSVVVQVPSLVAVKKENNDVTGESSSPNKVTPANAKGDCTLKITEVVSGPQAVKNLVHHPSQSTSKSSDSTAEKSPLKSTSKSTVAPAGNIASKSTVAPAGNIAPKSTVAPAGNAAATGSNVTVSSALCWNCGYCDFVTLNQSFLKVHLNASHTKKPHKYVALLVSGKTEMDKIKASDAQLGTNPVSNAPSVSLTSIKQGLTQKASSPKLVSEPVKPPEEIPKEPEVVIDNAEMDTPKKDSTPASYKCAHCNFSSLNTQLVKTHLLKNHIGHVIYGLDMRAVRLKQKRYVLYCLKASCKFFTKETDEYLEHLHTCMGDISDGPPSLLKSLNLTKTFIEKSVNASDTKQQANRDKSTQYGCKYCSYKSTNARLKMHVISNHTEKNCIVLLNSTFSSHCSNSTVYFCRHCLWETNSENELETHITDKKCLSGEKSIKASPVPKSGAGAADKPSSLASDSDSISGEGSNDSNSVEACYTEVRKQEYDTALSKYLDFKKSQERPSRAAALKCRNRIKEEAINEGKGAAPEDLPPLYSCFYCSDHEFGTELMRAHLETMHSDKALRVKNVNKRFMKDVFFCPFQKCMFTAQDPLTIVKHAKSAHKMKVDSNEHLKRLEILSQRGTLDEDEHQASSEGYQCLYCTDSMVFSDSKAMKTHFYASHSSRVRTFNECIAKKIGDSSRLFMCQVMTCEFTTDKQEDYKLHMFGHQKAKIYECSRCQWFTAVRNDIVDHQNAVHDGHNVTVLEIDLDLDSHGNIVRYVGGTVIKKENP